MQRCQWAGTRVAIGLEPQSSGQPAPLIHAVEPYLARQRPGSRLVDVLATPSQLNQMCRFAAAYCSRCSRRQAWAWEEIMALLIEKGPPVQLTIGTFEDGKTQLYTWECLLLTCSGSQPTSALGADVVPRRRPRHTRCCCYRRLYTSDCVMDLSIVGNPASRFDPSIGNGEWQCHRIWPQVGREMGRLADPRVPRAPRSSKLSAAQKSAVPNGGPKTRADDELLQPPGVEVARSRRLVACGGSPEAESSHDLCPDSCSW